MGTNYELKNRYIHVDYANQESRLVQRANLEISKCNYCTLEELAILKLILKNPNITQKELADNLGKSERTIKNKMSLLQEKNYVRRVNGKRYGSWEVLVDVVPN